MHVYSFVEVPEERNNSGSSIHLGILYSYILSYHPYYLMLLGGGDVQVDLQDYACFSIFF